MNVSDYAALQRDAFRVKTAVAIAANDLLQFGPDGRAYPVSCTDYAAVANCTYGTAQTTTSTGMIVAHTTVVSSYTASAYHRQALLQGSDGSLYTATLAASNVGIMLTRYSAAGSLISQVTPSPSGSYANHQMFFLSNGNICVIAGVSNGAISFAIFDADLNPIKALTNLAQNQQGLWFSACPLAGGGFAVLYHSNAQVLESRFVTYDNSGSVVTAPVAVWTRTGTSSNQYHRIALLSSGNLAVAVFSLNTVASFGLFYGVISPTGEIVKAFTNLDTLTSASYCPELSVMSGKFAIAKANGSNIQTFIFDDAGNLQGSGFSSPTAVSAAQHQIKLLNDGSDFWLLWSNNNGNKVCLTKLPASGSNYVTTTVTATTSQFNHYFDAFVENGYIVCVSQAGASGYPVALWVIRQATGLLVSSSVTYFGSAPSTAGLQQRLIPVGDFAFACLYDFSTPASNNLALGKYANTAVIGCANSAAIPDTLVPVSQKASGYAINPVKGSPSKVFDHSETNIIGNKGAIMNYGAVLKGI